MKGLANDKDTLLNRREINLSQHPNIHTKSDIPQGEHSIETLGRSIQYANFARLCRLRKDSQRSMPL